MPFIEWDKKFSVNVKEIDIQHQGLFKIINDMDEAISAGKAQEVTQEIVQRMNKYAVIHFDTEEKYMIKFIYPGYAEHKKEHEQFIIKVGQMNGRIKAGVSVMSSEITRFLKDWLMNHILVTDKKYGPYFNENGLI
jgi:hemerythrin